MYGLPPFGSERCGPAGLAGGPAGLAGFSLVLLRSRHDFACFYEVLPVFMGSCHSDQKGALPQLSLAFPWFCYVLSMSSIVFARFCLLLWASAVRIRKVRSQALAGFSLVLLCSRHGFACFC